MLNWGVLSNRIDSSIRLGLGARKLNSIILPTRDSSPPIDEILAKFNNKNVFSSLDFTSGY